MGPLGAGGSHISTAGDVIVKLNGGVVAPRTAVVTKLMKSTKSADASVAINTVHKNVRVTGLFRLQSWKPKVSRSIYPLLWLCLHESHSSSLSLALTIHFLLTFGARKTYSQLLQMHRLQCSTDPQLGHTFVERHKEGAG